MIESIVITTLTLFLILAYFRPGKTEPLQNPLNIFRVGQFSAVLAPKINLALPLLESISSQLSELDRRSGNSRPHFFKVHDKEVQAHGANYYLLAATIINGMLYFHATGPKEGERNLDTIKTFSESKMISHVDLQRSHIPTDEALMAAVLAGANLRGVLITHIADDV